MFRISKQIKKLIKSFCKSISKYIDVIIIFGTTFAVYVHNLSPSVFGTDSGDFLTASLTKGVAHPSGYPLFTMLGILFLKLPIEASPAWKMGLISAITSSFSVVLVYEIVRLLTKNRYLSVVTSLTLAFLYPFWLYSEIVEVFALHYFFILLLMFFAVRFYTTKDKKNLYFLAFFTGLSLTNNLTIILILPSIFLLVLFKDNKLLLNFKFLIRGFLLILLGLTPYIYIPIAASYDPFINWGAVVTFKNFLGLVLRSHYGWGTGSPIPYNPLNSLSHYFFYWQTFVNPLIPAFAIIGSFYLILKRQYKLFTVLLLAFIATGPTYFIYGARTLISSLTKVAGLERFYIQSIIVSIILFPFGIKAFTELIQKPLRHKALKIFIKRVFLIIILLLPLSFLISNFRKTNLKNTFIGDNLGYDILSSLPNKSVVMLQNDSMVFNTLYIQSSQDYRQDVYVPGMHDGLIGIVSASGIDEPEKYLVKKGGLAEYADVYNGIPRLLEKSSVYSDFTFSTFDIIDETHGRIIFVPFGLVNRLYFEKNFDLTLEEYLDEVEKMTSDYHLGDFENSKDIVKYSLVYASIARRYATAYFEIADFIANYYQDNEAALPFLKKALELDPLLSK